MKIEQLFTSCLAEMSYYVSDSGEAAIIDPLREPYPYIRMAEADNATIKYIFLTHFHADFVSGHLDLAKRTGATIVFGPDAKADYDFYLASDLEKFPIGEIFIQLLHTPGHTLESSSLVLIDKEGNTPCVFTGDCLFLDDVGRPDLAVVSGKISKEDLAGLQFDSLRNKLMKLPDDITVYPNHGAGSSCGKHMLEATFDTLGNQKKSNYALDPSMSKEQFTSAVLSGQTRPPQYFPKNARMNKSKIPDFDTIVRQSRTPLSPMAFKALAEDPEYLVIDARDKDEVLRDGTVKNAWFIGIDGNFAPWVGQLVEDIEQKIIFIASDESEVAEIATRFSRVGYDNVRGYLFGSIYNWMNQGLELESINTITSNDLDNQEGQLNLVDTRKESDYSEQHIEGSIHLPLEDICKDMSLLDKNESYYLYCNSGFRSLIASSILMAHGFKNITNINDSFDKLFSQMEQLKLSLTD